MTQSLDIRKGTVLTTSILQAIFLRMFRKINRIFPEQIKGLTTGQIYYPTNEIQRILLSTGCDQYDASHIPPFGTGDSYLSRYEKEIALLEKK